MYGEKGKHTSSAAPSTSTQSQWHKLSAMPANVHSTLLTAHSQQSNVTTISSRVNGGLKRQISSSQLDTTS